MCAMRRIPMCKDHPEEDLRFYCLICEDTICRDCKIVSHDSHKADLVSNVAKEMRQTLVNLLETTTTVINKYRENEGHVSEEGKSESIYSDTISEVSRIASATKIEIDKLVETIQGEIKCHIGSEMNRQKFLELTALKASIIQAIDGDYPVVSSYKRLTGCGEKLVGDKTEERLSAETKCEETLLTHFTQLSEKIVNDMRKFDVSRHHIRTRSSVKSKWSLQRLMKRGFWLLELILRCFPIIQSVPAIMFLSTTFPVKQNVMPVLYVICAAPCILMLIGRDKAVKTGVLIHAGILVILAFCFCPPDDFLPCFEGKVLIWSRHLGCIGVYFVFAGRQTRDKSLMTVGGRIGIFVYLFVSVVLLLVTETWLGGKYICFMITALFLCWRIYVRPESIARDIVKPLVCCIVIASLFIPVDKKFLVVGHNRQMYHYTCHNYHECIDQERTESRLHWVVLSVSVCTLNILIGCLSL